MKKYQKTILYILISIFSIIVFFPIIWAFSQSLKNDVSFFEYPFKLIPEPVWFRNYIQGWSRGIGVWFKNSLIVTSISTIISTFFATLTGYTFAKFKFRFKNIYFIFILTTMMVPWQVVVIPLYEMIVKVKLINTYTGLIIPFILSAFGIFLMRQFITSIPDELIEAARSDGASEIRIFFQIIIPLSKPAIATHGIFIFMTIWDEFYWPLLAGSLNKIKVLPVGLAGFVTATKISYNLQMAGAVISVIPILIIFIFLQRFIVKGFLLTGIKG